MQSILAVFVQNPAVILMISGLFFLAYLLLRPSPAVARPRALLWPAVAWALWAAWEFAVARLSPEADLRVDLLVIVPLVLLISAVAIVMLFVRRAPAGPTGR